MPVVLAAPPGHESVDPLLEEAVPENVPVYREYVRKVSTAAPSSPKPKKTQKNSEPGPVQRVLTSLKKTFKLNSYVTPFDRYLLDYRAAVRSGLRLIETHGVEVIYACGDPFTALMVGARLKAITGLPLVLDLRDPWSMHEGKMAMRPALTARALFALERRLFHTADRVILNTSACHAAYEEHYRDILPADRLTYIRNSFDPSLFLDVEQEPFDRCTILYFGTLRRFVGLDEFLAGFQRFVARTKIGPEDIQIVVMGQLDDHSRETADRFELGEYLHARPPVSLRESMKYLKAADWLLLVIQPECVLQIPGKLYDYLASETPIFAVSSNEEANEIIREAGAGISIAGQDPDSVAQAIEDAYKNRGSERYSNPKSDKYTASSAAKAMTDVFNAILSEETR